MKKNVLIFGLLSGLLTSAMIVATAVRCYYNENFEGNMVLGFTMMILAFSFIFVGIKNYRDKFNAGSISFGKGFKIGLLITLIASTMYVLTWLIAFYGYIPDFMEKYTAHVIAQGKADGKNAAEITALVNEMADYREMYKNPIWVVLFTYMEIFPVGLIITLISALILKRKAAVVNVA